MGFNRIIAPIAWVIGLIMSWLFGILDAIGIANVGLAIILLTVIIKFAMFPLLKSQLKQSKISRYMAPELRAIREKYRGRRDEVSMQKQNMEIKALYAKYGISQTGGCIQLIIQMPILLALYQVVRNIPTYIGSIKDLFLGILGVGTAQGIMSDPNYANIMADNFGTSVAWTDTDAAVAGLNTFSAESWDKLSGLFPSFSDVINTNSSEILRLHNFLGLNLSLSPNAVWGWYILVPICAAAASFFAAWIARPASTGDAATDKTQSGMMFVGPVISGFIAFTVPAGLGIYWISTSLVQALMSVIINRYYDKLGADEIIRIAAEKKAKKEKKKKSVSGETLQEAATMSTKKLKKQVYNFKNEVPNTSTSSAKKSHKNNPADSSEDIKDIKDIKEAGEEKKNPPKEGSIAEKISYVNQQKKKK